MNKRESIDFLRETSVNCIEVLHFIESFCQNNNQLLKNMKVLNEVKEEARANQAKSR